MRRNRALTFIIALCLMALSIVCIRLPIATERVNLPSKKRQEDLVIGIIKKPTSKFLDNCGCSLQFPAKTWTERYVFLGDLSNDALMNINGQDIKLRLVDYKEPKGEPKKGNRSTWTYTDGKTIKAQVDYVITGFCDPKDESCEVTYYDAVITVTRNDSRQIVKVTGICGC